MRKLYVKAGDGMMGKVFLSVLLFSMLCLSYAFADVGINEVYFPDPAFRQFILAGGFDTDGNGVLSDTELGNVTMIQCQGQSIKSLKGIEHFTSLTYLGCNDNLLMSLDVSHNTLLEYLYCYSNRLKGLDVTKLTALRALNCGNNQLTGLDVSCNKNLTTLGCYQNKLTDLDVSKISSITRLDCSYNQIKELDVTSCNRMESLECSYNQLTSLNVRGISPRTHGMNPFPTGMGLSCSNNQLKSLDVSSTSLGGLNCSYNQLTSLNVSGNWLLGVLNCSYNQMTELKLSSHPMLVSMDCSHNRLISLDVRRMPLYSLTCSYNQLTSLNVANCDNLKSLDCSSNQLTDLDLSTCKILLEKASGYVSQRVNMVHHFGKRTTEGIWEPLVLAVDASVAVLPAGLVPAPVPKPAFMIPLSATTIESGAFAGLTNQVFQIPASVIFIADDALDPSSTVIAESGSYAETRCRELGLKVYN